MLKHSTFSYNKQCQCVSNIIFPTRLFLSDQHWILLWHKWQLKLYTCLLVLIEPAVYLTVFLRQCYRAEPNKENYRSSWCNKQWEVYCFVRRLLAIFSRYRWRKLERAAFLTEHNMMNGKKTDCATAKSVGETKDHQCKSLEKPSFVLELCINKGYYSLV